MALSLGLGIGLSPAKGGGSWKPTILTKSDGTIITTSGGQILTGSTT